MCPLWGPDAHISLSYSMAVTTFWNLPYPYSVAISAFQTWNPGAATMDPTSRVMISSLSS